VAALLFPLSLVQKAALAAAFIHFKFLGVLHAKYHPPNTHAGKGPPGADWSTNPNLYYTQHPQTGQHHPPHTFKPTHLLPPPKTPQNKLQKKHFAKKCKNKSCRDALPPKNTSPKSNETSDNAHHSACADYPHITSQCIYRVATIPTFFQTHPLNSHHAPYSTAHPIFPSTHITIHNHQPRHLTSIQQPH